MNRFSGWKKIFLKTDKTFENEGKNEMTATIDIATAGEKPLIITPFQIFCHQEKDKAIRMNPHLKGIAITALLGKMWRALDDEQRARYNNLSMQLRGNPEPKMVVEEKDEISVPLIIPKFGVISHKRFGCFAAQASSRILLKHRL